MIASNYRKFPDAMALQLVLVFGRCTWHTARPTQRLARAVRAARAVLVKETPKLVRWVKKATPDWFKQAKRAARELANQVKAAMAVFVWDMIETAQIESSEVAKQKCRSEFSNVWPHNLPSMITKEAPTTQYTFMLFTMGVLEERARMNERADGRKTWWISGAGDHLCKGYKG